MSLFDVGIGALAFIGAIAVAGVIVMWHGWQQFCEERGL